MDLFSYTTKSAQIESLKLVKDIEEELRRLATNIYRETYITSNKTIDQVVRPFQLFTQCFKLFESKSSRKLPDFLYIDRKKAATVVVDYLVKYIKTPITYNEYIIIFKYLNTELILPYSSVEFKSGLESGMKVLIYLAKVIGNNPNPYKFDYSKTQPGELYSILMHRNNNYRSLLQALAIRQNLLNDIRYTVLEDYIQFYKDIPQTNPNPTATLETQQLLNASIELDKLVANHVI